MPFCSLLSLILLDWSCRSSQHYFSKNGVGKWIRRIWLWNCRSMLVNSVSNYCTVCMDLIQKWRPMTDSFVCVLIGTLCLVIMYKKQKNFEVKMRLRGLKKHANKRIFYWPPFWNKVHALNMHWANPALIMHWANPTHIMHWANPAPIAPSTLVCAEATGHH